MRALLQQKRAVLFDLDGTLIDSMWMWENIDREYLKRFGKSVTPELKKAIEGMSFTETALYFKERFGIPDSAEQIKADWISMSFRKYTEEVSLKPFALPFLKLLRRQRLRIGIATSNEKNMVKACLSALSAEAYFDVICTSCEVARGKPYPDVYLRTAELLETAPEDCLVFEDVPAGILAGKSAGMTVVAVEDAFSREDEAEKRRLADFFIRDYSVFLE